MWDNQLLTNQHYCSHVKQGRAYIGRKGVLPIVHFDTRSLGFHYCICGCVKIISLQRSAGVKCNAWKQPILGDEKLSHQSSTCIDNYRAPRTCTFSGLNLQAFTILFFLPSRNAVTNKPSHLANHDFITHRLAIGSGTPWAAFTCLRTSPFALWKGKVEVPPSGPSIYTLCKVKQLMNIIGCSTWSL